MLRNRPMSLGRCLIFLAMGSIATSVATADEFLRLDDPDDYELQMVGFELPSAAQVTVQATGLRIRNADDMLVYAWLLDSETREPVWVMDRRNSDRIRSTRGLRESEEQLDLDAGRYELYMYAGQPWWGRGVVIRTGGWESWFGGWGHDDDDWSDYEDEFEDCFVALTSPSVSTSSLQRFEVTGGGGELITRFNKVGDEEFLRQGFQVDRETNLHIYALIEHQKGDRSPADFAWVVNTDTRELVWQSTKRNTRRAGGGSKNRVFNDEVTFEPGKYILYYGTDDSHSYEEFNMAPPYDPINWGVTVRPGEGFTPSAFRLIEAPGRGDELVAFTAMGDSEFREQAFRLNQDGDIHVYAFGEYSDRNFYDYAWIVDAKTGRMAWEMTGRNTMAAGGAEKNRMFDGLVTLEAGDYILYYVSDGSHSWEDWNAATPFDQDAWGVTLYATDSIGRGNFELLSESSIMESGDFLVRMIRVGDHDRVRQRFTLEEDGRVHIYALGEGLGREMYDYGYIIDDDTGRVVWEMEYRDTDHAGGARKNRVFDDEIRLRAGTYEAVYVTDGSHSFEGFNASRPDDPMNWGMTIRKAEPRSSSN